MLLGDKPLLIEPEMLESALRDAITAKGLYWQIETIRVMVSDWDRLQYHVSWDAFPINQWDPTHALALAFLAALEDGR